jgi:Zn-dependent protease
VESTAQYLDLSAPKSSPSRAAMPTPSYAPPSGSASSNVGGAVYNTPVSHGSKSNPTTPKGIKSVPIAQSAPPTSTDTEDEDTDEESVAAYLDPNLSHSQIQSATPDQADSSGSFILVQQAVTIPPNAFRPDSGVDLSMVYKLEKSEKWHIMVALGLLFLMVFHAYINLMLIMYLVSGFQNPNPTQFIWQTFLLDPLVLGSIFAITFVIHEMAHLNMGKHFQYQSRFCLTKVGYQSTKKAAIIGFPLGLPGAAVSIGVDPTTDKDKMGWIKMAGPSSNLIFGTILLVVGYFIPASLPILRVYLLQGASLNFVLGAFNLIPISVKGFALDGENIIKWNKGIYIMLLAFAIFGILIAMSLVTQAQYA